MSKIKNSYLRQFIFENYPLIDVSSELDLIELSYVEMDEFARWIVNKLQPQKIDIGKTVSDQYLNEGVVTEVFKNFSELVAKSSFVSMTADQWLSSQEIKFTNENLSERWFGVETNNGGYIFSCESKLTPKP